MDEEIDMVVCQNVSELLKERVIELYQEACEQKEMKIPDYMKRNLFLRFQIDYIKDYLEIDCLCL